MQITPSSTTPTVKETQPSSGKVSRRRLFSLAVTATVASSIGIALGGTLRFQVGSVSQVPIFQPQQDFPPLTEWPPELPKVQSPEHHEFDTRWEEDEAVLPQLIYDDRLNIESENYEIGPDDFSSTEYASEAPSVPDELPSPTPADFIEENETQDMTNTVFEEEELPPVVLTNEDIDNEAVPSPPQEEDAAPSTDTPAWFNKRPISEFQLTDGPVIISPEQPIPPPDTLSD